MTETAHIDLRGMPNGVDALHQTQKFFLDAQPPEAAGPETVQLDEHERSVDGMIELGWEHIQLQRDLHLDYADSVKALTRPQLEALAAAQFAAINHERTGRGAAPIDISTVDTHVLKRISEPSWLTASSSELATQPDYLREMAGELRTVDAKLTVLSQDETIREAAHEQYGEKMAATKVAYGILKVDERRDTIARQLTEIDVRIARTGRRPNSADTKRRERLRAKQAELDDGQELVRIAPDQLPAVTSELNRLIRRNNHRQLGQGLLLTPNMQARIDKILPSVEAGVPTLLIGETGGAKTALARALSRQYIGKEPEFVSFHSEITAYQVIGKDRLGPEGTSFNYGPIVRAMEKGCPVILDEIDTATPDFLPRLNDILLARPGDRFTIQEDSGKQIVVQPGFCAIGTMNGKKDGRYRGREKMGAEAKDRFVKSIEVPYPDSDVVFGATPPDNMALAEAVLSDEIGELAIDLPSGQLAAFVRAAHASQKIFSGNYGEGQNGEALKSYAPQERMRANQPGLKETVLSPRRMVMMLETVRSKRGSEAPLVEELRDWVSSIEDKDDRAVMEQLLDSQLSDDGVSLLGRRQGNR